MTSVWRNNDVIITSCVQGAWRSSTNKCESIENWFYHYNKTKIRKSITVTSKWVRWRPNSPGLDCLVNRLFRRRSKKISKLRVTGLCDENSSIIGEVPAQRASEEENVSIWWRPHVRSIFDGMHCIFLLNYCVHTVRYRYNAVNFLPNPSKRHPIARPLSLSRILDSGRRWRKLAPKINFRGISFTVLGNIPVLWHIKF